MINICVGKFENLILCTIAHNRKQPISEPADLVSSNDKRDRSHVTCSELVMLDLAVNIVALIDKGFNYTLRSNEIMGRSIKYV